MQPSIEYTIAFIRKAHAGQVDKAGKPYRLHPEAMNAAMARMRNQRSEWAQACFNARAALDAALRAATEKSND